MLCHESLRKAFSIKTILGNFAFINEENKSKEIQGKNVFSFAKFVLGGFCPGGFCPGGFCRGLCPGVFCPVTKNHAHESVSIKWENLPNAYKVYITSV